MLKLHILVIESLDPYQNLVFENRLFEQLQPHQAYILLWRNSSSIIIGRAQNPWLETNINYADKHNIPIIRRSSGGGTVYHDEGNINFSFMAHKPVYNKYTITPVVNDLLISLGLDTTINERNDILLNTKEKLCKISGSAYREAVSKGLHHGTLLVSSDLAKLREALKPHNDQLETKAIKSLRSSVSNLAEINNQLTIDYLLNKLTSHIEQHFADSMQISVNAIKQLQSSPEIDCDLQKFYSWEWNFGRTPHFKQKIEGQIDGYSISGYLEVNQGLITAFELDSVSNQSLSAIQHKLQSCRYQSDAIKTALQNLVFDDEVLDNTELTAWLIQQIK